MIRIVADEALRQLSGYLARLRAWLAGMTGGAGRRVPQPALAAQAEAEVLEAPPKPPPPEPPPPVRAAPPAAWPPRRIAAAEALWGQGFVTAGGKEELLRLAKPLGLRNDMTVLLLGGATGGPATALASTFGCWVAAFEADPDLHALAAARAQQPGPVAKRITLEPWTTDVTLRPQYYHHCMALSQMRDQPPDRLLAAIAGGLRPGGQLVLVEVVGDDPLDPADPVTAAWCRLEHQQPRCPSEQQISTGLGRLGFDVRVAEDISERHVAIALAGWREVVGGIEAANVDRAHVMALVTEAERWLYRVRLIRAGRIRMVRWHAIKW